MPNEAVAGMETAEVELVIDQVTQGMLETAGEHLPVEVHRQQFQAFADWFETRHFVTPCAAVCY